MQPHLRRPNVSRLPPCCYPITLANCRWLRCGNFDEFVDSGSCRAAVARTEAEACQMGDLAYAQIWTSDFSSRHGTNHEPTRQTENDEAQPAPTKVS